MERNNRVAAAVRRALIMSALTTAGVAAPALAQQPLGEIVVTGSRIRSANLEATTPVTQVTAVDVVTRGVTRVEDLVNQLPQAFAAQNVNVANGASGTATLNLRGLGSPRTLVLIDGRRMPYGGVTNSAADINQIPAQMIERVDVLTGGASAVYGSDAVAGVVNFIMKKDFEGVEVTSQYNFYWHENDYNGPGQVPLRQVIAGRAATNPKEFFLPKDTVTDGEGKELSVLMGINSGDGRGNITVYASAFDSNAVLQGDRDYSVCSLGANPTTSFTCGGSSTSAGGRFTDFSTYNFTANDANSFRNFDSKRDLFNFGPTNHYQRPEERFTLGAMGHYEFNEHAEAYTQLMFTQYESVAQIAPGGDFFETNTINCDNPFLPPANLGTIGCDAQAIANGDSVIMYIGRRNVEGGGRQSSFRNEAFRMLGGLRGDINDAWDYDVAAQYSSTQTDQATLAFFGLPQLIDALDAVTDPDTGQAVCRSRSPGCVPYNPFVPGGVTQEQIDFLQVDGVQTGTLTQEIYNGIIHGDLTSYGIKLPWASEGVQVVFGAEYRRDTLENTVDPFQEAGLLAGSGGPTIGIDGAVRVRELFFEGKFPLVQDQPFAESLTFDTAYRYSDYDSTTTDTYKFGLEWAPVSDVRFRGSFQRAVRAANIVELFTAQGFNLFDLDGDPCGDAAPNPNATAAECIATGVPASFFDGVGDAAQRATLDSPAGQYQFLQGGNEGLTPEESDTYSFGIILTPRFAPGLSVTVDWFNIDVDNTISTFGSDNTLNACYTGGDAAACSRINRAGLGQLWIAGGHVVDTNINIGSLEATGVDVNVNYSGIEIGRFGSLNFSLTGTWMDELITEPGPGIDAFDCIGFALSSCGTPNPEWRHRFVVGWQTPWDVDLTLTWRYYDSVTGLSAANVPLPDNRIDRNFSSESYFDLAADWAVTEKASLVVGINNFLDDDPTLSASVGTTGNGNTFPQTYDALGRYVFARARIAF